MPVTCSDLVATLRPNGPGFIHIGIPDQQEGSGILLDGCPPFEDVQQTYFRIWCSLIGADQDYINSLS